LRVLVDESLPVEIAPELSGCEAVTVHDQGWLRLRNGVLLRAAVDAGFSILLTADSKLRYQQNLMKIGIAVVVVVHVRNRIEDLRPLIPRINGAISNVRPGEVVEIAP
jgi:hypothetical protein